MAIATLAGLGNLPEALGAMAAGWAHYWLSLPKACGVPMKRALELGAMRRFAPNLLIVERFDRTKFTWRLAGSAVREIFGVELTGSDALAVRDPVQRVKGVAAYNAQLDVPCGAWGIIVLGAAGGIQRPSEVLALPLRADDGSVRFIANTVEPRARAEPGPPPEIRLLSWLEHRFVDIGFGLPKFPRPAR